MAVLNADCESGVVKLGRSGVSHHQVQCNYFSPHYVSLSVLLIGAVMAERGTTVRDSASAATLGISEI